MRALSRRSGFALLTAAAAAGVIGLAITASAETDDAIARLLARTAQEQQHVAMRRGNDHKVVPAERPRPEDERLLIDEIEMLERARAEAEARRSAMGRDAEEHQRVEDARKAEEDHRLAEEQQRLAERERADAERKAAEERRAAEAQQRTADAEYARMEAEREAEAIRIDEALRKARQAWLKRQRARASDEPQPHDNREAVGALPSQRAEDDRKRAQNIIGRHIAGVDTDTDPAYADASRASTRVTILMVLEPGKRGIRRHSKTADPLLCGQRGCYVGTGSGSPAKLLPRRRAFGMARTLGERAGACRNSLGCVFRGVDLTAYPAVVQPVDMRFLRHDRREPHVLDQASRCRLEVGRLSCTPVEGVDYIMWVVPERIAERAGPEELERVVKTGLRPLSASIAGRQ
jgi:colicin import membrane protein